MAQFINLLIGIAVLFMGIPVGNYLAKETKEELKQGQVWFKLLILASCFGIVLSLVFGNDILLFTFAFIVVVTSRSLKGKK